MNECFTVALGHFFGLVKQQQYLTWWKYRLSTGSGAGVGNLQRHKKYHDSIYMFVCKNVSRVYYWFSDTGLPLFVYGSFLCYKRLPWRDTHTLTHWCDRHK